MPQNAEIVREPKPKAPKNDLKELRRDARRATKEKVQRLRKEESGQFSTGPGEIDPAETKEMWE